MNECNKNFIKINEINLENIDCTVKCISDINPIFKGSRLLSEKVRNNVCVEHIIGIDNERFKKYLLTDIFDILFDKNGSNYQNRSIGMLKLTESNVLERLESSFEKEPIVTLALRNNLHLISDNGLHRFCVLRMIYLNEKNKMHNNSEISKLKDKFTIPIIENKVDYVKTFCSYLIQLLKIYDYTDSNIVHTIKYIENEYKDYYLTGNVIIYFDNGETKILSNEELLSFTKRLINGYNIYSKRDIIENLQNRINTNSDLKEFCLEHFSDTLNINNGIVRKNR